MSMRSSCRDFAILGAVVLLCVAIHYLLWALWSMVALWSAL